jgi:integrase
MASVFKAANAKRYTILYFDENGDRRKAKGCTDKAESERIANRLENEVALRRAGLIDRKAEVYRDRESTPLANHIADWEANLVAQGFTTKHAEHTSNRVRRLVAMMLGAKEALIDHRRMRPSERGEVAVKIKDAIARFKAAGWSLQTCNHYRAAAKAFSKWCYDSARTREDILRGVKGFNVKEDRRHDRRTVSLDELRTLIEAAEHGPIVMRMTGPQRALCYRLAVASGLRYSEIAIIAPESFDWNAPSVTVEAAYTKNGETATLPLPTDLAADLAAYVAPLPPGKPIFPLPADKGAKMLRKDLAVAGIEYEDVSGLFFDFHSLRCQTATLADQAGISPRVVQKMMRHSSLELTGRYTRPRAVDIEAAAGMLPNLKPEGDRPEATFLTGTDSAPVSVPSAPEYATLAIVDESNPNDAKRFASMSQRSAKPSSPVRIRAAPF